MFQFHSKTTNTDWSNFLEVFSRYIRPFYIVNGTFLNCLCFEFMRGDNSANANALFSDFLIKDLFINLKILFLLLHGR